MSHFYVNLGFPSCEGDWEGYYEHAIPPIPNARYPLSAKI